MAKNIIGNGDGPNGRNETYNIPGRGTGISRSQIVREIGQGKHPDHNVYSRNGEDFARADPNKSKGDNVNRD
ncbi:DUF3892 domain-containing protein [Kiloniella majae]|uniref:DUF3892 domain-containing protein n=1 Tax=Kiloniella majae TaxID=1938558 RepID=UPI000A277254|nr:DUF3892 domain-containing protein [Kiloniella majae]